MLVDESRIHRRQSTKNPLGRAVFVRLRALVLRSAIGFSTVSVIICGTMALGQVQPGKPVLDPAAVKSRLVVRASRARRARGRWWCWASRRERTEFRNLLLSPGSTCCRVSFCARPC